jgi:hypothetical protein
VGGKIVLFHLRKSVQVVYGSKSQPLKSDLVRCLHFPIVAMSELLLLLKSFISMIMKKIKFEVLTRRLTPEQSIFFKSSRDLNGSKIDFLIKFGALLSLQLKNAKKLHIFL